MRIVMMGTGTFAEPTFEALIAAEENVVGLVTQPEREVGRKTGASRQVGKGMAAIAAAAGIPVVQPASINTPEGLSQLKAFAPDLVVVAPDAGGVERARAYAKRLDCDLALADKRRDKEKMNTVEVMNIVGNVEGRTALIVDDMVDTAGSLTQVAQSIAANGAREVYACCTHAVLSGPAMERIEKSTIKELVVTNSIPPRQSVSRKVKSLSVAGLLAEAIRSIHTSASVSKLFV